VIEKKIAIITIHDIDPSCTEKLQSITDANAINKFH